MNTLAIDAALMAMLQIVEQVELTEEDCEFINERVQAAIEAALVMQRRDMLAASEN
jgi:hypothetical protein